MRVLSASLILFCAVAFLLGGADAQDKKQDQKEVTLKGKITCAKCELKVTKECTTVIAVPVDKKDVIYYFDKASHLKFHGDICEDGKNGTVTGTVTEKDNKKTIMVKTLKYDK